MGPELLGRLLDTRADGKAVLEVSERLWIEKVALRTAPLAASDPADLTLRDELSGLLAQGAEDAGLAATLRAEIAEFFARTPPDLGGDDDFFGRLRHGEVEALIKETAAALEARLAADVG